MGQGHEIDGETRLPGARDRLPVLIEVYSLMICQVPLSHIYLTLRSLNGASLDVAVNSGLLLAAGNTRHDTPQVHATQPTPRLVAYGGRV